MIIVDNLTKAFRDARGIETRAVDRVSFQCRPGEIFGLLGLNGAGKTTTMRMISTVLRPTSGTAIVAGHDVRHEPAMVRKKIGFLSGSTALYDRMSAWEHVEYFGKLYEIPPAELKQRMEYLFESLQMNHFRDMLVSKMSTGMKQKVSIARSLVHDPPVLVFDEPTSGLDVLVQRAVLEQIAQLRDAGKCIIFSTHIMREVEKLCDRIGIIHRGQLLCVGTLREILANHPGDDLEDAFFNLVSPGLSDATVC
jgi:sodium transport system ATP-binding protein